MSTVIQQPVGSMVTVDPFRDIINGMVQGAQLHTQLQQAQDEHDAMLRQAAQQERNNRLQDIQQQMLLNTNSRPVSPAGTVQDSPVTSTLGAILGPGTVPASDAPGSGADMSSPLAGMAVTLPGATRKADSSRVVKYKDLDGNVITRELYTPEEQNQRAAAAKQQEVNAGLIDVPIPPELQQAYGGQTTIKAAPGGVAGILRDMNQLARQNETFDISPEDQKTYGVPASMKGDLYDNFLAMKSRHIADQDAADRAAAAQKAQSDLQDKKDATTLQATSAREDAIQGRADQREGRLQQAESDKEERQKNGQVVGVTLKKQAALNAAEAAYRTEVNRLGFNTTLKPDQKQAQIAVAQKRLRDSKQNAQNAYEESMGALGRPIDHVEYPAVGDQQQQQATPSGRGGAPQQQAAPQIPPAAVKLLKEGTVTTFRNGQKWTLKGGQPQQVQ